MYIQGSPLLIGGYSAPPNHNSNNLLLLYLQQQRKSSSRENGSSFSLCSPEPRANHSGMSSLWQGRDTAAVGVEEIDMLRKENAALRSKLALQAQKDDDKPGDHAESDQQFRRMRPVCSQPPFAAIGTA
jgi:hypothetical protein